MIDLIKIEFLKIKYGKSKYTLLFATLMILLIPTSIVLVDNCIGKDFISIYE